MSQERTVTAIVLKRTDMGETDRRLVILTREEGKIDVVAKGARKSASRLGGISDPLTVAQLTLASGRKLAYVTQAQPQAAFREIRRDFDRTSMALALVEAYDRILPYHEGAEEAYDALFAALGYISKHEKPICAFLWAQTRLLRTAGFQPHFNRCVVTGCAIGESPAWFSPMAGGYVSPDEAEKFQDRYQVPAEALLALAKLPDLDEPPKNVKFAEEAARALFPLLRDVSDSQLPANRALIQNLSLDQAAL